METDTSKDAEKPAGEPELLYSWVAPSRLFVRRGKLWFLGLAILTGVIFFLLLLISEITLAIFFLVLGFVIFVLSAVQPELTEYRVLSEGIRIGTKTYEWKELEFFWFAVKEGQTMVCIKTKLYYPDRLELLLGEEDPTFIRELLSTYLHFKELRTSDFWQFVDGMITGVSKRLPINDKGDFSLRIPFMGVKIHSSDSAKEETPLKPETNENTPTTKNTKK